MEMQRRETFVLLDVVGENILEEVALELGLKR